MPSESLIQRFYRRYSHSDSVLHQAERRPLLLAIPDPPSPVPAWPTKTEYERTHVHAHVWSDLIDVKDELLRLQTPFNDGIYDPTSRQLQHTLARQIYSQTNWITHSSYSYSGPKPSDLESDWLFYVKAYRHCLGQLIDIFQLRGTILELYESKAEAPVSLITSQRVVPYPKCRSCDIVEQLKQKLAAMTCLVGGLIYIPADFQPAHRVLHPPPEGKINVHDFVGIGRGTALAIKPRLLDDEVWASRICYLAELGRIEDVQPEARSFWGILED